MQRPFVNSAAATPPEAEEPEWDADGNLESFGGTTFEWDARGRLVRVEKECADGSVVEVGFTYDWRNRLVERIFTRMVGRTVVDTDFREYVWDDWLLLLERKEDADGGFTDIEYVWGPDLSGAMQGAGGVGGLLAVSVDGDYFFPAYDDNGNVVAYFDESGAFAARYEYDAFGNTIASSGPLAGTFPHRFSTKYFDPDTGLYYYGHRWYSPELGRWISRDPIGEVGGINLFAFCSNNSISAADSLGLFSLNLSWRMPTDEERRKIKLVSLEITAKCERLLANINNFYSFFFPQARSVPEGGIAVPREIDRTANIHHLDSELVNTFHLEWHVDNGTLNYMLLNLQTRLEKEKQVASYENWRVSTCRNVLCIPGLGAGLTTPSFIGICRSVFTTSLLLRATIAHEASHRFLRTQDLYRASNEYNLFNDAYLWEDLLEQP